MVLKEICELCDFNEPIHITGFRKGRRYDITVPKYSEISTHCGRKAFICFMLSIGIRRVGINQPQADRFLAPTLGLVPTSIEVQTLAYGTGRAGAQNGRSHRPEEKRL